MIDVYEDDILMLSSSNKSQNHLIDDFVEVKV